MSHWIDDASEMDIRRDRGLSEADADALLSGRAATGPGDLGEIIGLMRTASALAAPAPNAALSAVLNEGFDPLPVASAPAASRWGRWSVRVAAATAAGLSVTLGAATANALPAPVQTAVAHLVEVVTPLELPRPAQGSGTGADDGDTSGERPRVGSTPEPAEEKPSVDPAEPATAPTTVPSGPQAPAGARSGPTAPATDEDDALEAAEPDTDQPDSDAPESDEPASDQPDSEDPRGDEPDGGAPQADEPDTDQPDTDQPDTQQRDTEQPHTGQPDTDGDALDGDAVLDANDADVD